MGFSCLRIGSNELGIKTLEFMKDREFHDQLRYCKFIAKILAA
jgi:hypothetical protein